MGQESRKTHHIAPQRTDSRTSTVPIIDRAKELCPSDVTRAFIIHENSYDVHSLKETIDGG